MSTHVRSSMHLTFQNPTSWDTDEETESGSEVSDHEHETDAEKRTKATSSPVKLRGRNSECSTPVKFDESIEDIDISQRGRLRKRRIIPNNAEDQNPVKKSKLSVKSETLPSAAPQQPLVVQRPVEGAGQAGKILIGYSELIKQLKAANPSALQGTNSPILLQTSQGGKVLVTSIVPSGNNSQKLRFVPPFSASATQSVPITMVTSTTSTSVKQSQHPTIQHLLTKPQTSDLSSGMVTSAAAVSNSPGLRHILPQTTAIIPGMHKCMGNLLKVFSIIPEFRIFWATFHGKSASKFRIMAGFNIFSVTFLAHLSRRLTVEL